MKMANLQQASSFNITCKRGNGAGCFDENGKFTKKKLLHLPLHVKMGC
jgi:hypothetical protein